MVHKDTPKKGTMQKASLMYCAHMPIGIKLALSYALAAVFLMATLGLFYYHQTKRYIETQTAILLTETMNQAKDNLEYKFRLYNRLADTIYVNANLQDLLYYEYIHPSDRLQPQRSILAYIQPLKNSYKEIVDLNLIVSNYTIPAFSPGIISERLVRSAAWYQRIAPMDDHIFWNMTLDSGEFGFTKRLKHLIYDSHLGLVHVRLNPEMFFSPLKETGMDSGGWFDIITSQGEIIYSGQNADQELLQSWLHKQYRAGFFDRWAAYEPARFPKQGLMALHTHLTDTDWNLVYILPMDSYLSAVRQLRLTTLTAILLGILLFGTISMLLSSGLTRRIGLLSYSMERVQKGDFEVQIQDGAQDEIGRLAQGFNTMAEELKKRVDEVYTIQIKEKESELRALQAHINPHFLYNTLASISWLSMRIGSDDITRISNALARFYKLSLSKGSSIVNLQEEIDHVKAYMSIQEIRFKSRIRMLYEIAPEALEIPTLKLILQPFVENALVHGMWREKKTITIKLQIEVEDHVVTAKIIDDGVGIGSETLKRLQRLEDKDAIGYGIVNVDQRLKLYYGDRYGVDIFSRRGIGTVISVIMPIR